MFKIDEDFRCWLNRNHYGYYNGYEIAPQTELVAYTYVISAFVITFRHSTRYYFKEVEKGKALLAKMLCILCNLLFGWWGIPWGPIWTIKETFCDLIGSDIKYWGSIAGKPSEEGGVYTEQLIEDVKPKRGILFYFLVVIAVILGLPVVVFIISVVLALLGII